LLSKASPPEFGKPYLCSLRDDPERNALLSSWLGHYKNPVQVFEDRHFQGQSSVLRRKKKKKRRKKQ
jgi:hypothetical protein